MRDNKARLTKMRQAILDLHSQKITAISMPGGVAERRFICQHCRHDWPCPSRTVAMESDEQ